MNMTGGPSSFNAGCNLVLISGTSSSDCGVSIILGVSSGSDFGGSMRITSSSITYTRCNSATIKTDDSGAGTVGVRGEFLFSTGSATYGNSSSM